MTTPTDKMREDFEVWLGREAFTERSDTGKYVSAHVDAMWSAWQAALSTPLAPAPEARVVEAPVLPCPACGVDRARDACPKGYIAPLTEQCPMVDQAQLAPAAQPAARADGMPSSADERLLRRLLAARVSMPATYFDDGEAHGAEHGIAIDFMREPVADIDAKLRALNVARALAQPAAQQAPAVPQGWRLVPVETTPEMRNAFHAVGDSQQLAFGNAGAHWKAMLDDAPNPPAAGWQPIETAPMRGEILLWTETSKRPFIGEWGDYSTYNQPRITRWHPLPAAPQAPAAPEGA